MSKIGNIVRDLKANAVTPELFVISLNQLLEEYSTSILEDGRILQLIQDKNKTSQYDEQWNRLQQAVKHISKHGDSDLMVAIRQGSTEQVNTILADIKQLLPSLDLDNNCLFNQSLLHMAVYYEKPELIELLIHQGYSQVNSVDQKRRTALSYAIELLMGKDQWIQNCDYKLLKIIKQLVAKYEHYDVTLKTKEFNQLKKVLSITKSMSQEAAQGLPVMLQYHLQLNKPEIEQTKQHEFEQLDLSKTLNTLGYDKLDFDNLKARLHDIIAHGELYELQKWVNSFNKRYLHISQPLQSLLQQGTQANILHVAANMGQYSLMAYLKRYQHLSLQYRDNLGNKPYYVAVMSDHPKSLEVLLSYPETERSILIDDDQLLDMVNIKASQAGPHQKWWQIIQNWIKQYNLTYKTKQLKQTIVNNNKTEFKMVCDEVASLMGGYPLLKRLYIDQSTLLTHYLAELDRSVMIKHLHEQGVDFYNDNIGYQTPLHRATCANSQNSLLFLLDKYPSMLDWCDYRGESPIKVAVRQDEPETFQSLLKAKGDQLRNNQRQNRAGLISQLSDSYQASIDLLEEVLAIVSQHCQRDLSYRRAKSWQHVRNGIIRALEKYSLFLQISRNCCVPFERLDSMLSKPCWSIDKLYDQDDNTLLHVAAASGCSSIEVRNLIEYYSLSPLMTNRGKQTALTMAAQQGQWLNVDVMLNLNNPDDVPDEAQWSELRYQAIRQSNFSMLYRLYEDRPNSQDKDRQLSAYCQLFSDTGVKPQNGHVSVNHYGFLGKRSQVDNSEDDEIFGPESPQDKVAKIG